MSSADFTLAEKTQGDKSADVSADAVALSPMVSRKDGELIDLAGVDSALARKMELVNNVCRIQGVF
jgi:hypothetical protein